MVDKVKFQSLFIDEQQYPKHIRESYEKEVMAFLLYRSRAGWQEDAFSALLLEINSLRNQIKKNSL